MTTRNGDRVARRPWGPALPAFLFPLVLVLLLSAHRGRPLTRHGSSLTRDRRAVGRSRHGRSEFPDVDLGDSSVDRHSAETAGGPGQTPVRVRVAPRHDARRREGVTGFVVGLLLVTLALAGAVALAAQPIP